MTENHAEKPMPTIPMLRSDFMGVILLGALVGFVVWGLGGLLDRYIFESAFCGAASSSNCASASNYAAIFAAIIASIVGLAGLIRLRVYRPLLVLIASMISLWGIVQLSWQMSTLTGLLIAIVLYALAFGAFTWILRLREFWIALVLTIILVVAVRLALTM